MRESDWSSDVCSSDLFPSHDTEGVDKTGAADQGGERYCGGGGERAGEGGVCPAVGQVVHGSGDAAGQGVRGRSEKTGGGDFSKERQGEISQIMQNSLPYFCGSRWRSCPAQGGVA